MRKLALALGLFVALGCSGLTEQLLDLADVEMAQGEDAVHPADFPLPPPPGGTIENMVSMTVSGRATVTLTYEVPADADADALMSLYEQAITELGGEPSREGHQVACELDDGTLITARLDGTQLLLATVRSAGTP